MSVLPVVAAFVEPLVVIVAIPLAVFGLAVVVGRLLALNEQQRARDEVVVQPQPESWNAGLLACAHRRCEQIDAARARIAKERERLLVDDALLVVEQERLRHTFAALGGARRNRGSRRPSSSSPAAGSDARVLYLARARSHCSGSSGPPYEEGDGGYPTARPAPPTATRRHGPRSEPPGA